jgi:RNA polymerase sigma-70 factor, ECF subfamily
MVEFDEVIRAARSGGDRTVDQLFSQYYPEIRRAVQGLVVSAGPGQPVQPTQLVHEAYLRLRDLQGMDWQDRNHFLRTVVRAVRRALVDEARQRKAIKRGGGLQQTTLVSLAVEVPISADDLIALDQALEKLRDQPGNLAREAEVVDLHFFFGMNAAEIAATLGISDRQVRRDFAHARAWLRREIGV